MTDPQQTLNPLIHIVARDSLLERLEAGRPRRLTLVHAPVGFGKTTLITQWQAQLKSRGLAVAWVALREDSWTPELFVRTVAAAVDAAGIPVKLGASLLVRQQAASWRPDFDALLEALEHAPAPVVIFLDEYEHCDTPAVNPVVAQLLGQLPERVHLVIASRQRPTLPIARLYAEGRINMLGADDLRLAPPETAELLQNHLPPDGVERVHRLTEGWVVLVQLARLWLGAGGRPAAVIDALTDPREEVARFLAEQVLTVLPAEERDFLVETSFLDRLTPALSDYVRRKDGSERFLDAMGRLYPLVSADGSDSSSVRVHPLLRAEAQHLLTLRGRSVVSGLQRRAAEWLSANGEPYAAMYHAVGAGDPDLAADIFERAGAIRLIDADGPPLVDRMLRLLPKSARENRPRVRLAEIALLTTAGKRDEALSAFADLARQTGDFTTGASAEVLRDLRTDSLVVQMFLLVFCDETISSSKLREFEHLNAGAPAEDLRLRAFIAAYLAVCHLERGELASAHKAVQTAKDLASDRFRPYQSSFPVIYEGMLDQIAGSLIPSAAKLDAAIDMTQKQLGSNGNLALLTALSLKAEVLLDLGRFDDASAALHQAQAGFSSLPGWFEIYAPQLRVRYTLAFLAGGVRAALASIDSFGAELVPFQSGRMGNLMLAHRVDACVRSGELDGVDLEELERRWQLLRAVPNAATWRELDVVGLAFARAAIAFRCIDRARETLDVLELLATQQGWRRTLIDCHALAALAHLASGAEPEAVHSMRESLSIAREHGIRGPYLAECDQGAHLIALVSEEPAVDDRVRLFASALLRARRHVGTPTRIRSLTPREHLVLSQLCHGHANKVIARNLGMSENTVKTHLKSIFRKADIQSREEAIALARQHIGGT